MLFVNSMSIIIVYFVERCYISYLITKEIYDEKQIREEG